MPLGLCAEDFASLGCEKENHVEVRFDILDSDSQLEDSQESDRTWTGQDDRGVVKTVSKKFRLSAVQWIDCARIAGKDRDSPGTRWKMLVGEGDIGLRPGRRTERMDLDIRSW